ncbi:Uncharacterised protein [Mycobacteroides abscessus subsp. abscessus]|nr:Uncharacterised protein [Mycobacteroides abscessus subsp. abscessus]SKW83949.1 Uncharacterised protein [Mycobacteroides abscessus subsp. abscessus]
MRPVGNTLTNPRSGEPEGPASMNLPSSARRTASISPSVPSSLGTTSVAANRKICATCGSSVSSSAASGLHDADCRAVNNECACRSISSTWLRSSVPSSARPSA